MVCKANPRQRKTPQGYCGVVFGWVVGKPQKVLNAVYEYVAVKMSF